MKERVGVRLLVVTLMAALLGSLGLAAAHDESGIAGGAPALVSYQGQVLLSGTPYAGPTGYFKFAVVDSGGATNYWANDGTANGEPTASVALAVSSGLFNVLLGDTGMAQLPSSAFSGTDRYLRVWFSSDNGTFTQLSPDRRIAAAPYAMQAQEAANADTLDGADGSAYQLRVGGSCDAGNAIRVVNADGSVTCEAVVGTGSWLLAGNAGTTPGTNYLGTSDNQALEIKVNADRALRLEPNATSPNLLGGYSANWLTSGVYGATIGGGGMVSYANRVTDNYGTVGGGANNQAGDNAGTTGDTLYATVSGGTSNVASGQSSTVGGGENNLASYAAATVGGGLANQARYYGATVAGGQLNNASKSNAAVGGGSQNSASEVWATVGGGYSNLASFSYATVGGGDNNEASGSSATAGGGQSNIAGGDYATVPGGASNTAAGAYSFAAGFRAKANNQGCFVWADSTDADFECSTDNQFAVRANGGVTFETGTAAVQVNGSTVWHAGNDGTGSTLDADLLDGQHAADFAPAGHNHDMTYWSLTGNAGTTPGTNYLGTSDNQALEIKVKAVRALRLEPNGLSPNLLGGYSGNWLTDGVFGATISGGGQLSYPNRVTDSSGTVGGGIGNQAGDNEGDTGNVPFATVGGGWLNAASSHSSTIGGGYSNQASAPYCAVGGGRNNSASYYAATVGGGMVNTASSYAATVGGGDTNSAGGERATVAGGRENSAGAAYATVGGGYSNLASFSYATVGGGDNNEASGSSATAGGGQSNIAGGDYATVPGGAGNTAAGAYSFAAGFRAKANNQGCFVWADSTDADYTCSKSNLFAVRATGGLTLTVDVTGGGLRLRPDATSPSLIAGHGGNALTPGVWGATIGGGGNSSYPNRVTDNYGTVGGGANNRAGDNAGTTSDKLYATVAGGASNVASGERSTVPGGSYNVAAGAYSFAAGRQAKANNQGCFVWGDSTSADVNCSTSNGWVARASGGVTFYTDAGMTTGVTAAAGGGSWASVSDRNLKENVEQVDSQALLASLAQVPVATWNYKSQDDSIRHIGPMAQDFYAAFGVGEDDTHITTVDADGVALAAIQGLYQQVLERDARIAALEAENAGRQAQIDDLAARLTALEGAGSAGRPPRLGGLLPWLLGAGLVAVGGTWTARRRAGGGR